MNTYPKTLVVSINAWRDGGDSNTLLNLFRKWDNDKLSQIYIRSELPDTQVCHDFFQIPETHVIKRLLGKNIATGHHLTQDEIQEGLTQGRSVQEDEKKGLSYARSHRSWLMKIGRECVWKMGTWKSKELKQYLSDGNWDVVFCPIYPLILMNRLQAYILKKTGLKGVAFIGDDNYSYKSGDGSAFFYIHRFFLRRSMRKVIKNCEEVFVMVPKMKREYDKALNIDSKLLTKGIDFNNIVYTPKEVTRPIQIYYTGKLIYGRDKSLAAIASALKSLNQEQVCGQLQIYTPDTLTQEQDRALNIVDTSYVHDPVPYTELDDLLKKADVVVFAESMEPKYRNLARLSFSTKITDYFKSGKCIFAVGPEDSAPIEYLQEHDAAIVATSYETIQERLQQLIADTDIITSYSDKAFRCGRDSHDANNVDKKMYEVLTQVAQHKNAR